MAQKFTLHLGDCMDSLGEYPDNHFHSVVTDPPYGLGREPNAMEMLSAWIDSGHYAHKRGGGFMGKEWDSFTPPPALWREVLRAMRPGAHLLTFGGARTYDLLTLALRLAGFEIRDCIYWIYGSGFPKSLDVSKAIDKSAGAEREIIGNVTRSGSDGRGGTICQSGGNKTGLSTLSNPATESAREWSGWGTALKPACEPIVLARKPLEGKNVAANVLKWHAGAVNVDAGRIEASEKKGEGGTRIAKSGGDAIYSGHSARNTPEDNIIGRWPANVILDDEAAEALDMMSGESARGASRFFYCAKASRRDRDEGLEDFDIRASHAAISRMAGNENHAPNTNGALRNHHPTVKPLSLMRYLVRLITPCGGVTLDPFAGSGSTGKAAMHEGFAFVGMEREPEYIDIARARIEHAIKAVERERLNTQEPLPLAE